MSFDKNNIVLGVEVHQLKLSTEKQDEITAIQTTSVFICFHLWSFAQSYDMTSLKRQLITKSCFILLYLLIKQNSIWDSVLSTKN